MNMIMTVTAAADITTNRKEKMMEYLTVALAKGRLAELSIDLFSDYGMDCAEMKEKTRKLIFTDEKNKMKFI